MSLFLGFSYGIERFSQKSLFLIFIDVTATSTFIEAARLYGRDFGANLDGGFELEAALFLGRGAAGSDLVAAVRRALPRVIRVLIPRPVAIFLHQMIT